jgi:REP element-mobilizing transposase RayT
MPRKSRIDAPGALHHIIIRGIERNNIFKDKLDRKNFLNRLGDLLPDSQTACYAWALMPNHVHLLMKTGLMPMATVMRRLLTGYAMQFNRRHQRHGHLFQNRYKSFLCEEEIYLKELVRYIHLNPLRAKIVEDINALKTYPFSGHGALMGKIKNDWQDIDYVLGLFGKKKRQARQMYATFLAKGISRGRRPDLVGGGLLRSMGGWSTLKGLRKSGTRIKGDERILGSSDFVEKVLKTAGEALEEKAKLDALDIGLDQLIFRVADSYGVTIDDVKSPSKQLKVSEARSVLCYLAVRKLCFSSVEVSRSLNISPSTVSVAVQRAQKVKGIQEIQEKLLAKLQ